MNTMREKQVEEAVLRMDLMNIHEDVIIMFQKSGDITLSENGKYYPLDDQLKEDIRRFEQEHDATVFLVVRMATMYGTLDSLLFVGKHEEEWEMSREDLEDGYAMSYTINRDYPECSEMGSICFAVTECGVIIRECALPGFVDSKNEEKTERNAGYLVVSHSGGGMLRQGTRKGIRRTPANRGMRAHRIVKSLDISEDVCHGLCP